MDKGGLDVQKDVQSIKEIIQDENNNVFDIYLLLYSFLKKREASACEEIYGKVAGKSADYSKVCFAGLRRTLSSGSKNYLSGRERISIAEIIDERYFYTFCLMFCIIIEKVFSAVVNMQSKGPLDSNWRPRRNEGLCEKLQPLNSQSTFNLVKIFKKPSPDFVYLHLEGKEPTRSAYNMGSSIEGLITQSGRFKKGYRGITIIPTILNDYSVDIYNVPRPRNHSSEVKPVKIAIVPFSGEQGYLNINTEGPMRNNFSVNINEDIEERYTHKVKRIMEEVITRKINIVIFPEMVFTNKMIDEIKKTITNCNASELLIVIAGTVWNDRANVCTIIEGSSGKEIIRQKKLNAFHQKEDFNNSRNNEDIYLDSKDRVIHILDINGVGRVAVPVCVDFITHEYFEMLRQVGVNIIFNPTYTSSLTAFKLNAGKIGQYNYASVFLSNCCCPAVEIKSKNEEKQKNEQEEPQKQKKVKFQEQKYKVTFYYTPFSEKKVENSEKFFCLSENCTGKDCEGKNCMFFIEFSNRSCKYNVFGI